MTPLAAESILGSVQNADDLGEELEAGDDCYGDNAEGATGRREARHPEDGDNEQRGMK